MKTSLQKFFLAFSFLLGGIATYLSTGCSSDSDSYSGSTSVSVGYYYGTGFYDPWYHGGYYGGAVIVTPPRPPRPLPPRPTPYRR